MFRYLVVLFLLENILLGTPCDGQFHWAKNYRREAQKLRELLEEFNEADVDDVSSRVKEFLALVRILTINATTFSIYLGIIISHNFIAVKYFRMLLQGVLMDTPHSPYGNPFDHCLVRGRSEIQSGR